MKATRETVLAIIPAYGEGRFIADVVRRVIQHVQSVLVVDDGSPDCTAAEAEKAGAKVIRHPVNFGKGAALKTGLEYATSTDAEYYLFMDGDGQHDPSEIPAFFDTINGSNADLVVGNRMCKLESMPLIRRWTNQFMSWQIGRICKIPILDSQCGFRLARKELLSVLMAPSNRFEFEYNSGRTPGVSAQFCADSDNLYGSKQQNPAHSGCDEISSVNPQILQCQRFIEMRSAGSVTAAPATEPTFQ